MIIAAVFKGSEVVAGSIGLHAQTALRAQPATPLDPDQAIAFHLEQSAEFFISYVKT
jgi:hypothetical protein